MNNAPTETELLLDVGVDDLREPGPLSVTGERAFGELERAVQAGEGPVGVDDLRLLSSTTQTLADFGQLLLSGAAGDLDTLDLLRERLLREPGAQLWRDLDVFTARRPGGPIFDTPCQVGPANLPAMLWTGFQLSGGFRNSTWVERAFAEYTTLAGGIDRVLSGAQHWLSSGDPGALLEGFGALRGVGLPGQRTFSFPCLDEQQICLSEFLFFARQSLGRPSFPTIASVTPANACFGYSGPMTLLPAAGTIFPPSGPGAFPTIDRLPAEIISWTGASIQLRLPAGIRAGCHTIFTCLTPVPSASCAPLASSACPGFLETACAPSRTRCFETTRASA